MNVIKNLDRDIVLKAISEIKSNPRKRNGRESTTYDLVHNGEAYPPILVLSEANKLSGGKELTLSDFNNSTEQAFSILKDLGFKVTTKTFQSSDESIQVKPEPFIDTLKEFLDQSLTDNLKTKHYKDSYNGLTVKVSFGQGVATKIPWISFLYHNQQTSDGIYPVYLYYKKVNLLILAYGISITNSPDKTWGLKNVQTIEEYFKSEGLGTPYKYGSSYVYKVYDLKKSINDYPIDKDLYQITNFYKKIMSDTDTGPKQALFNLDLLKTSLNKSHLTYDESTASRFVSALLTKPFLILTGLSGSGKTKLAQAFAKWIIEEKKQFNLVPVGADWTNREPLFGYPNALEKGKYVLPESGVLQLILEAEKDENRPYFLILDEMNLSHVERYFADFLSAIESEEEIKLHSGEEGELWNGVRPTIKEIPKNLFIIGTVNIDETTYMFSPKVLDRANVIEFRVSIDEMKNFLENPSDVDLTELDGVGAGMATDFVNRAKNKDYSYSQKEILSEELLKFFKELNTVGAEFGYRSAYEIQRFAGLAEQLVEDWEFEHIMDAAISQKLLPKLHGSRRKLEGTLIKLGDLCHPALEKGCEEMFKQPETIPADAYKEARYPISFEKIVRMQKGLIQNGFTSFAEA